MELSDESIKRMQNAVESEKRYNALKAESYVNNEKYLQSLVDLVNTTLQEENCPTITNAHIRFYAQHIGNTGAGEPISDRLTQIIYDYYYPIAPAGQYAHFTDLSAFTSIINSGKIRLTSTIKRKDDLEYKLFYDEHNIDGYSRKLYDKTYDEALMHDLFYISLTENRDSVIDIKRGMWQHFGKMGTGLKLIFDIQTNHRDFRKVYYPNSTFNKDKQLVRKLNDRISSTYNKPFVFHSISKFGAFYIDSVFEDEFESRFLIKRLSSDYEFPFTVQNPKSIPYIELNFVSAFGSIVPIKVQPGLNCDRNKVQKIVDASGLNIEVLPNATSL